MAFLWTNDADRCILKGRKVINRKEMFPYGTEKKYP
jgi:hypothetical protein